MIIFAFLTLGTHIVREPETMKNFIYRLTGFQEGEHKVRTELVAGATTFITMCYILAVNPAILSLSGMPKEAVFTATAFTAAFATILMAFIGKLPYALAPGMGINAFFTYTICRQMAYSWQTALTITFIVGCIYTLLILFNIHKYILQAIPTNLQKGIGVGVGIFIAFVGLQNAEILIDNSSTLLQLGNMSNKTIVAFLGIILSAVFMSKNLKSGLFLSIIICTLIGIPLGVTNLPEDFKFVSIPSSLNQTFLAFDFSNILEPQTLILIFILLFISVFDTMGTLVGIASKTGNVDEEGNVLNIRNGLLSSSLGIIFGAGVGTSSVTTFAESTTGIAAGGRTGITSLMVGILFLVALFFSNIFLLIPLAATTGALVVVGVLMMSNIKNIDLENITEALPAYVTIIMIPLSFSIGDGVMMGILSYVFVKALSGNFRQTNLAMYILAVLIILKFALE